ncbi:replicative DNA helicase [Streptomyces sp. NPDC021354]|uniref:replicative DNA helicase n=1 Tax=Streptomyces sp. NPDC021354 TaxID=3154793 RepID=UPI00341197F5
MSIPQQAEENHPAREHAYSESPGQGHGQPAGSGLDRVPPQDLDAEQCVLGGVQMSQEAIEDVMPVVKPKDFYRPAHETIFTAVLDMYGRGEPVDPITLAAELTKRGELARVGGASYLHALVQRVPTAANAEYYAEIVHERAVLRRLVEAGTRISQMGYAGEGDVEEICNAAQAEVFAVNDQRTSEDYALAGHTLEADIDFIEEMGNRTGLVGIPTGFSDLDALTSGLQPEQMIVIAARPAVGKSTLALDFVRSCSIKHGMPSAYFSLEMGRREINYRLLSAESKVALHHIRSGKGMTEEDWEKLRRNMGKVRDAPLFVDASPNLTMMDIRAKARKLVQKHGVRMIIIDYLQLMQSGGRKPDNRQEEVSDLSRNTKLLAKELEVPVVALSQLNRGPEQRSDKKPMVSDLRESGSIEQDSDLVILLHREDVHEKESGRAGEADLIVAKHRNGPTATITVAFQGHYSRFVDMART